MRHGRTGKAIVAIGSAEDTTKLAAQIDEQNSAVDILTGPVRLEDVFAVITGIDVKQGAEDK